MALNKVLACALMARAAEMLAVPAIAAMARMKYPRVSRLVNFLPARCMASSAIT